MGGTYFEIVAFDAADMSGSMDCYETSSARTGDSGTFGVETSPSKVLDGTLDGSFTGLLTVDNLLTGDSQETIINGDTNIDIEVDIPEVGVSGETEVIKAELN